MAPASPMTPGPCAVGRDEAMVHVYPVGVGSEGFGVVALTGKPCSLVETEAADPDPARAVQCYSQGAAGGHVPVPRDRGLAPISRIAHQGTSSGGCSTRVS